MSLSFAGVGHGRPHLGDDLLLGVDVQLAVDVFGVPLHRAQRQAQLVGDRLVAVSLGHQHHDVGFARGEAVLVRNLTRDALQGAHGIGCSLRFCVLID